MESQELPEQLGAVQETFAICIHSIASGMQYVRKQVLASSSFIFLCQIFSQL
jgi:hypothetical protein